jgi:hypothetical protein
MTGRADERIKELERSLELTSLKVEHAVRLIASLLNPPKPAHFPPVPTVPDEQRRRY